MLDVAVKFVICIRRFLNETWARIGDNGGIPIKGNPYRILPWTFSKFIEKKREQKRNILLELLAMSFPEL
ncbi:CLUMA_CG005505, isoform A [Clunio marinus]|uniref:CLUMA_CG005505, isoform A n=1 Tax=Clunio marinus TaxID=568069 RepID=A0A1J1HV43_9DIPT|nr:CLUMA_CG005505, isoform A [Clunio marinus]